MTRTKASEIAHDFLSEMNPTSWNGKGDVPSNFDERIWEYDLNEYDRLDISFQYDDLDSCGWYHCCEIVDKESNEMVEILSGYGIDSALNLTDTILDLCKNYE